ncbi:hypothetical protein BSIN_1043 [Burkholderia singularis]|uniref:Uncharacterized protein n=1 Tax=Burkholderia singularis TaxID=1503053 RepID=A0A238HAQ9_9BURK|nr:hypothetical protein BSIN_1043 [Burkholderia singularis]
MLLGIPVVTVELASLVSRRSGARRALMIVMPLIRRLTRHRKLR